LLARIREEPNHVSAASPTTAPRASSPTPPPLGPSARTQLVLAAVFAALGAVGLGWGFTVDDALISTRVAHHIALGLGHRFNPAGPVVDCVTPLGWAWLLAPFSAGGAWAGLQAARWLGVLCTLGSVAVSSWVLGRHVRQQGLALVNCLPLLVCLPLGAWASAGMETPLIALLVTLTLLTTRGAPYFAALASALRPELLPWAFTLSIVMPAPSAARRTVHLALAMSGALGAALIRHGLYGSVTPLAVLAKPSDLSHGLVYAAFGLVQTGVPLLLLGRRAFALLPAPLGAHCIALLGHVGAVVVAGGDWMALYRLFVPVLPVAWVCGSVLMAAQSPRVRASKLALCLAASTWLLLDKGASARGVFEARSQLVQGAEVMLEGSGVVGTLDVGWVGAVGAFEVADFAGLTDPHLALLPGGHTSKRLPKDLLWRRRIDTLVLLTRPREDLERIATEGWRSAAFARQVEQRVTLLEGAEEFTLVGALPLLHTEQHYLVVQRARERVALRHGGATR
jgi:hypothetical protein